MMTVSGVPRVKICGLTRVEDALHAIRLGADGLGFLVHLDYPSEDELHPSAAAEIVAKLPPLVSSVLVTHATELEEVIDLCLTVKNNTLQLHGDFPLSDTAALRSRLPNVKIIKAVHVVEKVQSLAMASEAGTRAVDAVLLDTKTKDRPGGTGETHDWSMSRKIRDLLLEKRIPTILTGGLTPKDVRTAISKVSPFGVDVNSGVSERRSVNL